ncbi:uncharacterized protein LOC133032323 [Cannabis sativa]|uniref:uncharacterized protein LOC133032323 n=1 Tax=Cannabis sativa TaxID=3483 RepID=UPI0029CA22A3|nr:uncharacterized protein LOC133032323 [Cannabis sativa]
MAAYAGNSDPSDHLSRFNRVMTVMRVSNDTKCLCFPLTLSGSAEEWFKKLEPGSVDCWNKLQVSFRRQFVVARKVNLERFKEEASKAMKVDDGQQLALLQAGIRTGTPFWNELQQEGASNLQDFQKRVQKYINLEEAQIVAYGGYYLTGIAGYAPGVQLPGTLPTTTPPMSGIQFSATPGYNQSQALALASSHYGNPSGINGQVSSHSAPAASLAGPSQGSRSKRSSKGSNQTEDKRQKRGYTPQYTQYMELTNSQERVHFATRQNTHYRRPPSLYRDSSRRDLNKRCEYHNDIGHNTNECKNLKDEIENLIRLGHLYEWIKNRLPHLNPISAAGPLPQEVPGGASGALAPVAPPGEPQQIRGLPLRPNGRVAMISGGPHIRGTTRKELKRYARAVKHSEVWQVTQLPAQRPRLMDQPITFIEEDTKTVCFPHHDPLVIETPIANKIVARILIDNGSSVNLLFKEAFTAIALTDKDLSPSGSQLTGFNGTKLTPMGKVRLPVTLCPDTPQSTFKYCTLVVVDCPTAYNAILG